MSDKIWYGAKYDKNLSTKDIAARYRQDIKAAIKAGELPQGLKVSVRYESFAGGSAIRVHVTACPFRVMNPERVIADIENPHEFKPEHQLPVHTPEAKALEKKLDAMLQAYNFDGSDIMTDYFHVKFYGNAGWDWQLESAERKEITEEYEANKGWTLPEVA